MPTTDQLVHQAIHAFNQRDWPRALELSSHLLSLAPSHAGMHYIAGVANLELGQLDRATTHFRQAVRLDPSRADFATQLAKALSLARLNSEAMLVADQALSLAPEDPRLLDTLGVVYTQANAHEKAAVMFRRALEGMPSPHLHFNLATALIATGEIEAAERELEACIAIDPQFWKAHLTLAQSRRQSRDDNHLERLQSLLPVARDPIPSMYVHLAMAKEFEDLAEYPKAFEHLQLGKAAANAPRHYDIAKDEALFQALEQAFPEPQLAAPGDPTDEPIFIIGMPRSGTTLVERIISSHPNVHAAGELQNFSVALKRLSGSRTPYLLDVDMVDRARHINWRQLGEQYLASTRPATGHTSRFIDKLPHNFLYAGFIAKALPNAKIICLRRDPMDTCLSNFRQLFAQTSPYYDYSFDLLDTGRYYVLFDRLMAHWQQVFPGRILSLNYESLVDNQEASSRELLAFCELPWDDACLQFERNKAPVNTASAVQVREPINRRSVQRWRKYEAELRDLRDLLTQAGISVDS